MKYQIFAFTAVSALSLFLFLLPTSVIRARLVSLLFYLIMNVIKRGGMVRNARLTPGKNKGETETTKQTIADLYSFYVLINLPIFGVIKI